MNHRSGPPADSAQIGSKAPPGTCPICGPKPTTPGGVSNGLPIVNCTGCGLMYVAECPPLEHTQKYFREEYIKKDSAFVKKLYVDSRRKSLQRAASRIRALVPDGGRLLDIGTASGFFLNQFRYDNDWKVEGVEPSRFSVEYARQEFGLTVHQGFLADQKFPDGTFNVLCSLDAFVLHRTPREDMFEFFRVLTPGGFLAIEIPGHRFRMMTGSGLIYRMFRGPSLRLAAGKNFYYYTRDTLTQLAAIAGFEFVASYPEGMVANGNWITNSARAAYDKVSAALYRVSRGNLNFCAKELCIFRKPSAHAGDAHSPSNSLARNSSLRAA